MDAAVGDQVERAQLDEAVWLSASKAEAARELERLRQLEQPVPMSFKRTLSGNTRESVDCKTLHLNAKTYETVCGRYETPKAARAALLALPKARFKWITPASGARGSNPWQSKHGTEDHFFFVVAESKTSPATVYVASESIDTTLVLPNSLPFAGALQIMHNKMHCNAS